MPQHFTQNEYQMIKLALGHLESFTDCSDELEDIPNKKYKYGDLLTKYNDPEQIQNKYLENIQKLKNKLEQRIK